MSLPERQTGMTAQEARDLAAKLADSGIPCLPIALSWDHGKGKVEKRPLTPHGHLDATADPDTLADLFRKHVKYGPGEWPGVGTYPGPAGFLVVDVDNLDTLERLEAEHGPIPGRRVRTASGGLHLWMRLPEGVEIAQTSPWTGIDIRSGRGWVVAPGTRSPWGDWTVESGTVDMAPDWMLSEILEHETAPREIPEEAEPGDRHQTLVSLAASMWAKGLTRAAVLAAIRGYNETSCKPPKPDDELVDIVEWVVTKDGGPAPAIKAVTSTTRGDESPRRVRVLDGMAFLEAFENPRPAIWGEGSDVLWPAGEPVLVVSKPGVGKTTLAHNLLPAILGNGGEVLGHPVRSLDRPILYVAADRPAQAARSLARFREGNEEAFRHRLRVWWGPLPFDLGRDDDPGKLAALTDEHGCGGIVLDSLSNVASDISGDEGGGRINRAISETIASGYEVLGLHHQRKSTGENKKPQGLADVYGSVWITAGAGSVIYLHGEPGDPYLELMHLKSPSGEVGPIALFLDEHGRYHVDTDRDPLVVLRSHPKGIVASRLAEIVKGAKPNKNDIEKARRKLEYFVKNGYAVRQADRIDGGGGTQSGHVYLPQDGRLTVAS